MSGLVFKIITMLTAGLVAMPSSAEFRDPTQPAYPPSSTAETQANGSDGGNELVLSAIWISSQSRRATINGINAKEGQTIVIEQTPTMNPAPATPANTVAVGDRKNELLDKALELSNAKTNTSPIQENIISSLGNMAGPLGGMVAPLLTTAIGSMDIPRLQPTETGIQQQADNRQNPKTVHTTVPRSITIKIISIRKNSVIIDKNGELKTLQLVQRPYKIARNKYKAHL
jgi:hypothetical protein